MEIHYARNATAQGPRLSKFRISIDSSSNLYVCIHDFVYTHTVHTYMYIYMYTRTLFQVLQLSSYVYTWLYNVHVYAHDVVYMYCMVCCMSHREMWLDQTALYHTWKPPDPRWSRYIHVHVHVHVCHLHIPL